MNNSVFGRFLDDMRPYNIFNSHIWPSPEIWFETEHFEFLSFRASGSVSGLFTNWDWNHSRGKTKWNLKNWWVYFISTRIDEQNPEIVSKSEDFDFLVKFWPKLSFCKNRGDFLLKQWKEAATNSIRDIKIWNFLTKPQTSPSPVSLLPSQTDDTGIRLPVLPELTSGQNWSP